MKGDYMSTYPFTGRETTKSVANSIIKSEAGAMVQIPSTELNTTTYLDGNSPDKLPSVLTFKAFKIKKITRHKELVTNNKSRIRQGYQFVVKHEFIERETLPDGSVYDEPYRIYVVCQASQSAKADGSFWMNALKRLEGYMLQTDAAGTSYTAQQSIIDKLIRGITNQGQIM